MREKYLGKFTVFMASLATSVSLGSKTSAGGNCLVCLSQ